MDFIYWIVGLLMLGAIVGAYSGGWHRGKNGLKLWPFSVGKDGIHRQPLILFALLLASATVSCTNKYAPAAHGPDTTAVADSDHHGDHDRGKGKHRGHEDAPRP